MKQCLLKTHIKTNVCSVTMFSTALREELTFFVGNNTGKNSKNRICNLFSLFLTRMQNIIKK